MEDREGVGILEKKSTLCIFKRLMVHNFLLSFFFLNFDNCKDSYVMNFDFEVHKMG